MQGLSTRGNVPNTARFCCRWTPGRWSPVIVVALSLFLGTIFPGSSAAGNSKYAAIVVDHHTGKVLYARNADARRYPASLTKIMTLYMLFARLQEGELKLSSRLRFSKHAAAQPPSKLGLKPGQTIRVEDAIRALVTKSANDVAVAVAENLAGSEAAFAKEMTATARAIGMSRTTFANASGLPNPKQVTTARDIATLSRRIMTDFPEYYRYFGLKYFAYKGRKYRNHNGLLFSYKGTDGIKTGYIRASGFNLAASVRRNHKHLIAVVMGGKTAKSRNQTMQVLLNRALPRAVARRRAPVRLASHPPLPRSNPARQRTAAALAAAPVAAPSGARPALLAPPVPGTVLSNEVPAAVLKNAVTHTAALPKGGFHVQVGAYSSQTEAIARLNSVQEKTGTLLAGHPPLTMPVPNPDRYLFRARFAGFSESAARSACNKLKRRAIPCVVMRAQ
ncbi:MAG: D-alanyl-D-alanine carboxypeptidase [Methyloligellaceae bacterium]